MQVREGERVSCEFRTKARFPKSSAVVAILDVSTTGCRIRTDARQAKIGSTIIVELAVGQFASGEVVRSAEDCFGVCFHRPVSPEIIDQIAARFD